MKTMIACPPTEELRGLIDGSLTGDRQDECTQHLDSCAGCQAKLEEIATEGSDLSRVVETLQRSQPDVTSAYWPALNALRDSNPTAHDASPQAATPPAGTRSRELSLDFLLPASDSAYLGRIAHFDVMRILGRGGMGVVFEAYDSRLQRHVAIKVLDPELAGDDVARQRFCREARAAASITHPNVVAVHQVEKSGENGLPYMVMQLIAGESLEQRLTREKKLPPREIVRISLQAAQGLTAAHAAGLIHRDIKPGNILLEAAHDRVKLTDFGLARVAEDVKLTRTGFVSGTPLYMAPEQALGEDADPRSDLFSLGAIMYEMCAGTPPFTGNSALAILKQIADVKHRPLREVNPQTPDWLAETVDDLLAKKPADRYQTAADLAEVLDFHWAHLRTSSEELPTVCKIEEARKNFRNRVIAAVVGVTFLALGLIGGSFLANRKTSGPSSSAAPIAVLSANSGAIWGAAFDPTGDTLAMAVEDGSVKLWDVATESVKGTLSAHRGTVWTTRFAHAGERFATSGDDGFIKVWQPGESEPLKTITQAGSVRSFVFSHDDQRIFAGDRAGGVRVWSLDGDEPLAQAEQPGAIYTVALSPNDETLATAGSDGTIRLWNAKTLSQKLPLTGHSGPIYGVAFNQDGKRLASSGWDHTVRIWDTGSGKLLKSWEAHPGDIWSLAYSPDGAKLATGGTDGAAKVWNAETGALQATLLAHQNAVHVVAFSADGKRLASGGRDGGVRVWKME